MPRLTICLMSLGMILLAGCVENEESFFIEHAKVQPSPPDCTVSTGDEFASAYSLNLFNAYHPAAAFFVQNTLVGQADVGTLKAESNGILVDGYELYTLIPGLGAVGGTEYFEYNHYIGPESSDILFAGLMSSSTIDEIRSVYGCTYLSPETIKNAIVYGTNANAVRNALTGVNSELSNLPEEMFAVVRFLGHTQGGKEVQTQEFSIKLFISCGPAYGWSPCLDNVCTALCDSSAVFVPTCYSGVNQFFTCADYLAEASSQVTGNVTTDPVTTEPIYTVDPNGSEIFDICASSICNN